MKKICAILICISIILSNIVFAQSNEIVYIDESFIANAQTGWDITESIHWEYAGSAQTVTKNIASENGENYLSLSSDAIKNGGLGGSYYLTCMGYPVYSSGEVCFDIRLNEGKLIIDSGNDSSRSEGYGSAYKLIFDAENNQITFGTETLSYQFENAQWYTLNIDFNVVTHTSSLSVYDENDICLSEIKDVPFSDDRMFYVSAISFTAGDRNPFSFDIKNFRYVNNNLQNKSGGYMSFDENGVMHNTYPLSADETQALIDNKSTPLRRMEYLDRGVIAVKRMNDVYISWRWLGTEDINTSYNIYRDGVKINSAPITESTNYVDTNGTLASKYVIKSVVDGAEVDESRVTEVNETSAITILLNQYESENYNSFDGMVGDLDGDGEYEIVVYRMPENVLEGDDYVLLEAYKLDGTHLWTMNGGPNKTTANPVLLYDINNDGCSEVVTNIGDGFTDGTGVSVGDMDNDGIIDYREYVYINEHLEKGPEYIAIFNGSDGELIDKVPMEGVISREPLLNWATGTSITHRPWHFAIAPIKINNEQTSFVFCRGIYGGTGMQCWSLVDNKLKLDWEFDGNDYFSGRGQGNHNLTSGDVDYDGYDEIVYGAMTVDHNGELLYTTGLGHGDAIHMGDLDLDRPGLEVMKTNEFSTAYVNCAMWDARTGEVLWGEFAGKDTTRVLCDDIDPRYKGAESYTNGKAFDSQGNIINSQGGNNFAVYWDSDLLREMNDDITVSKYMAYDDVTIPLLVADECHSNNGTKSNCTIQADIIGDWREEIVLPSVDGKSLQIYTTTCPTIYKMYTLMHDPIYRAAIGWQNGEYNQPPHLGFNWGYDTTSIPVPEIYTEHNGVVAKSPYTDEMREYEFKGYGVGTYSSSDSNIEIVDGFARFKADLSCGNSGVFSEETANLLEYISIYYDDIIKSDGLADYVKLPTTKVYLPSEVRFVSDEEISITDITGIPIENITDGISYDSVNKTVRVDKDKSFWIKVCGESFEQIFNVCGESYVGEKVLLNDTLDTNPIGSGSDFLNSRMNINGWQLNGDSENVKVLTYADPSFSPKKRMVQLLNNSDTEAEFYLELAKQDTDNKVVAEFELQLRSGETDFEGEFKLSGEDGKKSLAIKQTGNELYVGTQGGYKLLASDLMTTTKNGAIYKIVSVMDFKKKKSDIILMYENNVVATMNNVDFYDTSETGIATIMLSAQSGSEISVDDIKIEEYIQPKAQMGKCIKLTAKYNDSGVLENITSEELDISEIQYAETDENTKIFYWNSINGMQPIDMSWRL